MWPYYTIIFIIIVLQTELIKSIDKTSKYKLAFLILFLFAALRGNGDGDYFNYLEYSTKVTTFNNVIENSIPVEVGFRAISYLVNILHLNSQVVIIVMNLISLWSIYLLIKKYSDNKLLSILLFLPMYFQYDMHAARTAVAIGIGTLSIKHIEKKDFFRFLIIVLLAISFHKSAGILFFLYFVSNININKFVGIVTIIMLTLTTSLISMDNILIKILTTMKLSSYVRKVTSYSQSARFGYPFKLYDPRFLLALGIYIIAVLIIETPNKRQKIFLAASLLNVILTIALREHTIFVKRIASYYEVYNIVLITYILTELKRKKGIKSYNIVNTATICIYSIYTIALIIKWMKVDYYLFF